MRVAIVGGGIIGCATALALRDAGAEVTIFERGELGAEASTVAAGILGAQVEASGEESDAILWNRVRARDAYAAWCESLEARSGEKTGYLRSGVIALATSEIAHDDLARVVAHQVELGLAAEMLDERALSMREPHAARVPFGAAFFSRDAQVEPVRLLRALTSVLRSTGVNVRRANVDSIENAGGKCSGVHAEGALYEADAVVLCAGAFTSDLAVDGAKIPAIEPVRGQLVTLREPTLTLSCIVFGKQGYVVPRGDGRLVCGTTVERVGFRRGPTAAGVREVLDLARVIAPHTADATFISASANFRPHAEAGLVVRETDLPRLFVATGHDRNGILLAKWTADEITRLVVHP